jgi:hypothetical protein
MIYRQRGALNLYWVAILSAALAAVAMVALISMRNDHNFFADAAGKAKDSAAGSATRKAIESAGDSIAGRDRRIKTCRVKGAVVISNTDCADQNQTTRLIAIPEGNVADAVKAPLPEPAHATSDPRIDKLIEKQLR